MISAVFGTLLFRFGSFAEYDQYISFFTFIRSMITSFIFIISGENYGDIVYVSVRHSPYFALYFIILTLFGSFIVVSLVVSEFQASYKEIHQAEKKRELFYKRTGFVAAFSLINLDDDNTVDKYEFESFIKYLKKVDDDEARELFRGLKDFEDNDEDGDGEISIDEFVESIERLYEQPTTTDLFDDDSLTSWLRTAVVEKEGFDQGILLIIVTELVLLMMYGTYPGEQAVQTLDYMLGVIVFLNALDVGVKLFVYGWNYYWHTSKTRVIPMISLREALMKGVDVAQDTLDAYKAQSMPSRGRGDALGHDEDAMGGQGFSAMSHAVTMHTTRVNLDTLVPGHPRETDLFEELQREFAHRLDFCVVGASVVLLILVRGYSNEGFALDQVSAFRAVMILPLFRLFSLIKTTRSAVYTIFKVLPRFSSLTALLFILFYVFAVWATAHISDSLKFLPDNPYLFRFGTFGDSMLTLFQLLVGEGWHDVMYAVMTVKDNYSWAYYFMGFVFLVTLIFANLFVGLVLSVVEDLEATRKRLAAQQKEDMLYSEDKESADAQDAIPDVVPAFVKGSSRQLGRQPTAAKIGASGKPLKKRKTGRPMSAFTMHDF
jgi:hypothetical protein